jgi:hypothetical protein
MALDLVCPGCSTRLRMTRPALLPAPVKCRTCGECFYAGTAMAPVGALAPPAPPAAPVALIPCAAASGLAAAETAVSDRDLASPVGRVRS